MLRDSFAYAIRNLGKRRLRSWLTIIGIFIGIAAVVSLISLGEGMRNAVEEQFSSLGSDGITVRAKAAGFGPPGIGTDVELTKDDLDVVKRSAHVQEAAGRMLEVAEVEHRKKTLDVILLSLPDDKSEREVVDNFLNPRLEGGRFLRLEDRGSIVIGATVATQWGEDTPDVEVGERLKVAGKEFDVVGIMAKKGTPQVDWTIIMNEQEMRDLLDLPEKYAVIMAKVDDVANIDYAKESIEKNLRKSRNVDERKEDFIVETAQDILNALDDVLAIVTGVLAGIAAISLIVGGIGIMNTMYTAVVERTDEIGIMKAVGATNNQILTLFLIESGLLGLVGGIIGVLLGILFSKAVEFGAAQALGPSVLQAHSAPSLIIGSLAFSFIVGMVSGTFPARQAAKLQPVEALRG